MNEAAILQALLDGKTIQYHAHGKWHDQSKEGIYRRLISIHIEQNEQKSNFRIKPESVIKWAIYVPHSNFLLGFEDEKGARHSRAWTSEGAVLWKITIEGDKITTEVVE